MGYVLTGLDELVTSPYIPSPVYVVPSGFLKINKENMVLRSEDLIPNHTLYAERLTVYSTDVLADEEGNIILDDNGDPTFIVTESTVCGTEPFPQETDCILDEHVSSFMISNQAFFKVNALSVCIVGAFGSCDESHSINTSSQEFFLVNTL